jgi:hypothetical protein
MPCRHLHAGAQKFWISLQNSLLAGKCPFGERFARDCKHHQFSHPYAQRYILQSQASQTSALPTSNALFRRRWLLCGPTGNCSNHKLGPPDPSPHDGSANLSPRARRVSLGSPVVSPTGDASWAGILPDRPEYAAILSGPSDQPPSEPLDSLAVQLRQYNPAAAHTPRNRRNQRQTFAPNRRLTFLRAQNGLRGRSCLILDWALFNLFLTAGDKGPGDTTQLNSEWFGCFMAASFVAWRGAVGEHFFAG